MAPDDLYYDFVKRRIGQCPTCGNCLTMDHDCGPLYKRKEKDERMEDRLMGCPGCGGVNIKTELWGDWFTTACQICNWQTGFHQDEKASELAWNTRATDPRCKCSMRTSLVGDGCRYCNSQHYIDMLEGQIKEADPLMEKMAQALDKACEAVWTLMNASEGVAGLHLNGDVAPWVELRTGGQFESWLIGFDEALETLKAYKRDNSNQ